MTPTLRTRKLFGRVAPVPVKDPEPEPVHKFSNTQIPITGRAQEIMKKMAAAIPDIDLAEDGREGDQHVTIKFGLHFQSPTARLKSALQAFGPVVLTLGKTSLFSNPNVDVVKAEVDSPDLHKLNRMISRLVPTKDTHPTYAPHATIAYVKPGRGKKYAGDKSLVGQRVVAHSIVFSGHNGKKVVLPLVGAAGFRGR